ncbi:hypothetical protein [Bradyrhizobium sp. CW1]|uniref:hypothetical protein n=1 Tax=Bradyrhizobium sp. CW1 TaxID=2782686 RepID=UPI001FFF24B4|nr:hypothetical protein [Bradyrhizobium sp. CW1]UPJ28935.1 hypothetical protein IVB54_07830 [Bradyrhizobium sp. CW1]
MDRESLFAPNFSARICDAVICSGSESDLIGLLFQKAADEIGNEGIGSLGK